MLRFSSLCLLVISAVLLGGCGNQLYATKPWFTAKDAQGVMRPGWWISNAADCSFGRDAPSAAWPECVQPLLVSQNDQGVLELPDPYQGSSMEYLLAPGTPLILQLGLKNWRSEEGGERFDVYLYSGVEPVKRDRQGRLIVMDFWSVLCGPPPPRGKGDIYRGGRTSRPWPGLTMNESGGCTAHDVGALRDAASRSHRRAEAKGTSTPLRWIRDWRPGDQTREEWLAALADQSH